MKILQIALDNYGGGKAIYGLGDDNRMYLYNYEDMNWDLLQFTGVTPKEGL